MEATVTPTVCHISTVHDALDDRVFYRECLALVAAGYHVVIVAQADKDFELEGVQICALAKAPSRLHRMTWTVWYAYRTALRVRADLYHLHDPELLPLGFLLHVQGKSVIYDAHEDLPNDILAKTWIPQLLRPIFAWLARVVIRLAGEICSGVVAATPRIATRFPTRKTAVVANYPGDQELLREPLPFAERPNDVVYIGSLSQARGLMQLIRSLINPAFPNTARVLIAGSFEGGPGTKFECELRALPGWGRIEYQGWQQRSEILQILRTSKVGIVLLHPQASFLDSLPTKLFEYMAAAMPVVASDFPLWRTIIGEPRCGILVDPLDCTAIAEAVAYLLHHPQEAEEMGHRGRQAVFTRYCWRDQASNLLALYARLLQSEKPMLAAKHA
jgi:glycosyltransferase involved in cell wall biosynthesis